MIQRRASARWEGTLREGKGTLTNSSGVLRQVPYTFASRFESGTETNPEELIGAAHAGCFSMAFSGELQKAGMSPESIETDSEITLEQVDGSWKISRAHLLTRARVPGADQAAFQEAANRAKEGCPVSKLLNAEITLSAELVEESRPGLERGGPSDQAGAVPDVSY